MTCLVLFVCVVALFTVMGMMFKRNSGETILERSLREITSEENDFENEEIDLISNPD